MAERESEHVMPKPDLALKLVRNVCLWAVPLVIVLAVMSVLATMYLGGTINSSKNLSGFPIALVDRDTGATTPEGSQLHAGATVTSDLYKGINHREFDVRRLGLAAAEGQLSRGTLYGAIVIPRDFSESLLRWSQSAASSSTARQPQITVLTNPRSGTGTPSIVTALTTPALSKVDAAVGQQLLKQTETQLAAAGKQDVLTGAARSALASPLSTTVTAFDPLPAGTGNGLSAFYFALLIVLAGFTGSMIVSSLVDSGLGFVPSEFGPVYRIRTHTTLSRTGTLVLKWAIMAALALVVSAIYTAISAGIGMPIDHPLLLWAYSAAAVFAVAVVAQSVTAVFGGIGVLVNLFIFIVFSLPSAGGTIPLEATPPFFRWLGAFEPMHQIYLGTRSVLYLGGHLDSGLGRALVLASVAAVLGAAVGLALTRVYDRRGYVRADEAAGRTGPSATPRLSGA